MLNVLDIMSYLKYFTKISFTSFKNVYNIVITIIYYNYKIIIIKYLIQNGVGKP